MGPRRARHVRPTACLWREVTRSATASATSGSRDKTDWHAQHAGLANSKVLTALALARRVLQENT
eukprot:2104206-Rhodomonas_salina.1